MPRKPRISPVGIPSGGEGQLDNKLITTIRNTTNKGMAIGNEKFIVEIKELTGYHLKSRNRGRPKGWRKERI